MQQHNTNASASRQAGSSFAERRAADLTRMALQTTAFTPTTSQPKAVEVSASEAGRLTADQDQLKQFVDTIFKRCEAYHGNSFVALRAFQHQQNQCVKSEWAKFDDSLVQSATDLASSVANLPNDRSAVFCLIPVLFGDQMVAGPNRKRYAGETNVIAAPAICVELDKHPEKSLAMLEMMLGPATTVIASGGTDFSGAVPEKKLHAYWRLRKPATSDEEKALLKRARKAAAIYAGADTSAPPLCHPMRAPGSWHTKTDTPRLCRIIRCDDDREVDLHTAAEELQRLVDLTVQAPNADGRGSSGFKTRTAWPREALISVVALIPNDNLTWDHWNKVLMALFDASHGSADGREAAHAFSEKSTKYDAGATDDRWDHYLTSPPTNISDRSLLKWARDIDPEFRDPFPAEAMLQDLSDDEVDDIVGLQKALTRAATETWPEPIDIFGDDSPLELGTPPAGALPDVIERWAISEARRKGVSTAFAAASAITVCAAAIGNSLSVRPRVHDDGWVEPAGLWTVLVAEPGRAKSPTISAAVKPLRDLDTKRWEANKPKHDAWLLRARKRGAHAPDPGPEPRAKRCLIDDTTLEEQVRLHAANPRGLLRAPDELVVMFGALGAYKNGPEGDRGQMLRMFDGGEMIVDRVKSGSTRAGCALMSVIASTQPEKIAKLARDLSGDGLLQRLVFIVDDGVQRKGIDEAPDHAALKDYNSLVKGLAEAEYIAPAPIRLSAPAYAIISEASNQIAGLGNIPGASPAWRGHIQKWGKLLLRVVLTFHAIEQWRVFEEVDPSLPIDSSTAERAVLFSRFLLRHSLRFYETYFPAADDVSEARWIAGHLLVKPGLSEVTRRDLCRARPVLTKDRRKLLSAMGELENMAWAAVAEQDADGPKRWKINPTIHVRFAERAEREKAERAQRREMILRAGEIRKSWLTADNLSGNS
ncbi:DUF3987 domain-containing protein [Agrobacterium fabrum]|uniref:DUF3987 domain-containing protein n=1 Tax=Agrobacterium fabrum TaxID=1176649 RepID=UPI003B9E9FE9